MKQFFAENLLAIEKKKTQRTLNKPASLELAISDISKITMYDFWYNYIKPKHCEKAKLRDIYTDSFIVHVKRDDIYIDIAEDVEKRFDTSNYEISRPLPMRKNENNWVKRKNENNWVNEGWSRRTNQK